MKQTCLRRQTGVLEGVKMKKFPSKEEAARDILEIGRRMYARGYVAANDGNISCLLSENRVLATPTGVSKGHMTAEMLIETDLDGNRLSGTYKPTSELKMHLVIYRNKADVGAVVHAHPAFATSFAVAGIPLNKPTLTEAVMLLGDIPVVPYAMPGTSSLSDGIIPFLGDRNGLLLANHGAVTWGRDLFTAYYDMESLEHYAQITLYSEYILKKANTFTENEVAELMRRRKAEITKEHDDEN